MEKSSQNDSYFCMAIDAIVFLLCSTIFIWIRTLHKFYFSFLSLFSSVDKCRTKVHAETAANSASNEKDSVFELYQDDLEIVMRKMGISHVRSRDQINVKMAFDELSNIFEEKEPSLEEVKEAFSVFDKNCDGYVDASDLQRILCEIGFKSDVELDECNEMIRSYDENKDGRIDFNEFVKFMETSCC